MSSISKYELQYAELVKDVLMNGERRLTRNGYTTAVFGRTLTVDLDEDAFPLLSGRTMYPAGIFGELAAMLRRPKHVDDFRKWGCNYWDTWADADGNLVLDYGNSWFDYNGVDQIARLKETLRNNDTDRRMVIDSWRPDRLDALSLPCCHYSYQFYVEKGTYLHMLWNQRSADLMVGVPSDAVFAAAWLMAIAKEFFLIPGKITLVLGDTHIYEEHDDAAEKYLSRVQGCLFDPSYNHLDVKYIAENGSDFTQFDPSKMVIANYHPVGPLKLELKA
jgi:thymidylate synthase